MKRKYIKGVPVLLALMIISSNSALAEDAPVEVSAHQTSVAKLEYQRAVFNYEQAVTKGIMSLGN